MECLLTPTNSEGPNYREGAPERLDLNVAAWKGTPLHVRGTIRGADCQTPVEGAVLDLWHADPDGFYDNDSDIWSFRGTRTTDAEGRYEFFSLVPAIYGDRPRHIHFKVWAGGEEKLTSQIYFAGDERLKTDPEDTPELIIDPQEDGTGVLVATFNLSISL